jgi:hypothetical protein
VQWWWSRLEAVDDATDDFSRRAQNITWHTILVESSGRCRAIIMVVVRRHRRRHSDTAKVELFSRHGIW